MKAKTAVKCSKIFWIGVGLVCVFICVAPSWFQAISFPWKVGIAALPALLIVVNQCWIIGSLLLEEESICPLTDRENFVLFYIDLATARGLQGTSEIRESYSHLREHANSVLIVMLEVFFALGAWALYFYSDS